MQPAGRQQRRPRFTCMGLNAAGRPVPMFDPFFDGLDDAGEGLMPAGPVELLLFGGRDRIAAADLPAKYRTTA
ncbi:hypothetical protein HT585_08085 [Ensifer sp. HO-A22]|uniref:Uncharacterized protein n=1 Tax=Ensifer oleiphilus TaxID=2742698 RepID=A0A7Y6Q4B9_9HYPH|nr:hypothetical protein [Ensifer oleiphilus]NVD38809.1 hypothetical protein [Ensifer oleiphilus]